ncbi:putative lipid II flippase MurJ [Thalassocella blandensis]|nr:putative lipid II flippase MurJ [Thalassocella blandensis]
MTSEKSPGLLRSSVIVSAMTMLSRVLGLARDVVFARYIGAEANADAFFVAFKVPNFLRRLFAEGAFSQAFVPVLSEYRANGSQAAVQHFIDRVAGCLGVSLIVLCSIVVLASPVFTALVGFGFYLHDPAKFWLTSDLLRITFPYLFLISLTGFAGAILNSYDRFAIPAITPVFLNISLIFAAAIASSWFSEPAMALAWGVIIAGSIQLLFQVPFLLRLGLLPHPKVDWQDESVRKVLRLMAPAMFGVSVSQINLLFDTILASLLPTGSVSWLYFSDRLVELPLGVFGVGIATVVLPNLSRDFAKGAERFSQTLDWAMRMVLLIALPATAALIFLADPILYTLFQYGKTTTSDVLMSGMSLKAYAIGLSAFMLIKILASGFFSRQDTRTPVKIGIIAMVANMVLNVVFVLPFYFWFQAGHVGLALATSMSAFLNAALLFRGLRQCGAYTPLAGWAVFIGRIGVSITVMLIGMWVLQTQLKPFAELTWLVRCFQLAGLVVIGGLGFLLSLVLLGFRLRDLRLSH